MLKYTRKLSISKLYNSLLAMALTLIITVVIAVLAALTSGEQAMKRESAITPDLVVMKRESFEIAPEFEEALNVSMRRGDYRLVNWEWAEVA